MDVQVLKYHTSNITVFADYATYITSTIPCRATVLPALTASPALPTGGPLVGHGRVHGRDGNGVAAAALSNPILVPTYASAFNASQVSNACHCLNLIPATPATAHVATVTSHTNVSSPDTKSACLSMLRQAGLQVVTTTVTDYGDDPVVNYITLGATQMLVVTQCA